MKTYRVFASVYDSVDAMLSSRTRDHALELQNVSKLYTVTAESLNEAIKDYVKSEAFKEFIFSHRCYFYYLDDVGNPKPFNDSE